MDSSLLGLVEDPVRKQFQVLTENLQILSNRAKSRELDKESITKLLGDYAHNEYALASLRERAFMGLVMGNKITPLTPDPSPISTH